MSSAPPDPTLPHVSLLTPVPRRGHPGLPVPLDDLIGREAEVASLVRALRLRSRRLLVLTGPGGVGKTRLALAAASEAAGAFADGAIFVSLAPIRDPDHLVTAIAQAADIRAFGEVSLADRLVQVFADRDLLLILDNFEHLLAGAGRIGELLAACPCLTALVTSRARLQLTGEHDVPVMPLALPALPPGRPRPGSATVANGVAGHWQADATSDLLAVVDNSAAVQLFVERSRAVNPAFQLAAGNAGAVAEICCRLDGLPLAIELAAAQSRLLAPGPLLARLEPSLPLLQAGPRDQPDRLQTMRNAIAWSYDLLEPADQAVFAQLSVFVGGFGLEAAAAVAGASLGQIASLVDQSLLVAHAAGHEPRFTMLETIREFGLDRLAAAGLDAAARNRHAAWYLDFALQMEPALYGEGDQLRALRLLVEERPNLRAAFAWLLATGDGETALRLITHSGKSWYMAGLPTEASAMVDTALAAAPNAPAALRAWAMLSLSMLCMSHQAFARAAAAIAAALPLVESEEDPRARTYPRVHTFARFCQSHFALFNGDFAATAAFATEAERVATRIESPWDEHAARFLHAKAELYAGNLDRAEALNRGLFEYGKREDIFMLACARHDRGTILSRRGDHAGALAAFAQSLRDFRPLGDTWNTPMTLDAAAAAAGALGHPSTAVRLHAAAVAIRQLTGAPAVPPAQAETDQSLAAARAALGETAFTAAWAAGAREQLDELIDEVAELARSARADPPVAAPSPVSVLTPREREVLALLIEGRSDPQIGAALSISSRTVESHVGHILAKLRLESRTAVVAHAVRHGLV